MLKLKPYQSDSLEALGAYFRLARGEKGASAAFTESTKGLPYFAVPQLPGMPYICLRVPTGGGKTLMACHALGIAAKEYRHWERVACLWLVPTKTIQEQTLAGLKERGHPYRQALDERFSGRARAMDLGEALSLQRGVLDGETVIIVSTLQALRKKDTEGRKVYMGSGALQHHFENIPQGGGEGLERRASGSVILSLANVLRMRQPVVIMDEAHKARTPLSFDTLARFAPSCVIEFTATPETETNAAEERCASNVLHQVAAASLKAQGMVKLPLKLRAWNDPQRVISEAVLKQKMLQSAAEDEERQTGEYIRPIVLIQAQPINQPMTAQWVKQHLMKAHKIDEKEIAIETRDIREVAAWGDLRKKDCPIRFVITVRALTEGWDCSFAYVLASVADIGTPRDVEQVLGRVMRLPLATRKRRPELNHAYAFVASARFNDVAKTLQDALVVEGGFDPFYAARSVAPMEEASGGLFVEVSIPVSRPPAVDQLPAALQAKVSCDGRVLSVTGLWSDHETKALLEHLEIPEDREKVETALERKPPATPSEPFLVPWLAIREDGQLEPLGEEHFLGTAWNLEDCDATLSEAEFPIRRDADKEAVLDVNLAGRMDLFVQRLDEQFAPLLGEPGWTPATLIASLDRQIHQLVWEPNNVMKSQSVPFIQKVLVALAKARGLTVEQMGPLQVPLARAIEQKIRVHRQAKKEEGYQQILFGGGVESRLVAVSPDLCWSVGEDIYDPGTRYRGGFHFQKHFFQDWIGAFDNSEEEECAHVLDGLKEVKFWIRNVERKPWAFWLPVPSGHFYPDFVAMLQDERLLIVESKGAHLWDSPDSVGKRRVGNLWAARSRGRCLFVMPKGRDWAGIIDLLKTSVTSPTKTGPTSS